MPKLKTHSGSKKRFHILTKKPTKRTRHLRAGGYADATVAGTIRKMIPYK